MGSREREERSYRDQDLRGRHEADERRYREEHIRRGNEGPSPDQRARDELASTLEAARQRAGLSKGGSYSSPSRNVGGIPSKHSSPDRDYNDRDRTRLGQSPDYDSTLAVKPDPLGLTRDGLIGPVGA